MGLIENPDLRAALASWPGDFNDVVADEANAASQITPTRRLVGDLGLRALGLSAVLNGHGNLQRRTDAVPALRATEVSNQ